MSLSSNARDVLVELLEALRAEFGPTQVVLADGGVPDGEPPFVLVSAPSVQIVHEQAALTNYHVVGTLEWWALAGAAGSTEDKALAALDLASEICRVVQDAHNDRAQETLYQLTILLPSWDQVLAEEPGLPLGAALVHGTIRYETDLQRGG